MKKKIIAFAVAVALTVSMLPVAALADEPVTYNVSVDSNIQHCTVSAVPMAAAPGETVTLSVSPDAGYELDALTVTRNDTGASVRCDQVNESLFAFTMPESDVMVSVAAGRRIQSITVLDNSKCNLTPGLPLTDAVKISTQFNPGNCLDYSECSQEVYKQAKDGTKTEITDASGAVVEKGYNYVVYFTYTAAPGYYY